MEIEVGDYVRTEFGVSKIKRKESNFVYEVDKNGTTNMGKIRFRNYVHINDIVKHSSNIIDLIEAGDLIKTNQGSIFEINEIRVSSFDSVIFVNDYKIELHENEIKSIVTKEQIKQIEYRIKE